MVKKIGGVTNVQSEIEVLPLWQNDAIHLIIKNGNVTLKGIVDNASDSAIAEMQANGTPGVFSVDNDPQIANPDKS